nr:hypothetical protein [Tanacetum cinerariifolium]
MTGNKAHLADYQEFKGGCIAFGGSNGRITGKGKIKAGRLDFEDVYYVEELKHYNLFFVSKMCDKKNKVLFTDTDCLVLSPDFKLLDENQVLLKIPRQHNMYSFNLNNIDPSGDLAYLFAKVSINKSNKWHTRLGHVNFKNLNKLVRENLVSGLPSKIFQNDHTCVACQKGKQHKASYKAKIVSFVNQPLQILHMDLFRPASIRSINHKTYCLVITNGFSRSDNGTEFKNNDLIELCGFKWIKGEYSNARTPQQNGVAERKNETLIEAARTMVLVTKPQNKTPYELLTGRQPIISYLRPFGCHVTILNTIEHLGKFDGKSDSWFIIGYSLNSKAFRVYNLETMRVEENLHVNFLKNKPNVVGKGHAWMFDLDYLTNSMNYKPVLVEHQANKSAEEIDLPDEHFVLPIWSAYSTTEELEKHKRQEKEANDAVRKETTHENQNANTNSNNLLNVVSTPISIAGPLIALNNGEPSYPDDPSMPHLKDIYASLSKWIFTHSSYDDEGVKVWILVDLPFGKKAIRTKWIYRNKKDEKGVVVRNKKEDGIFISQDKYVVEILKMFDFLSVKSASTLIKTQKPLVKDEEAADVDVTPKTSHLQAMKRIFRYLKGQPKLGLWYPKVSSFDLKAYSDSDYAGANLDRKSTTGVNVVGRKLQEVNLDMKSSCWDRGSLCVGFHTTPQMVINSPCLTHIKNWLVQEQTALGKDFSNPFMADNLPKIIWFSTHHASQ